MTRGADLMYDTRPPPSHRSRIILGDGSIKKVQFVVTNDLVFHSRTDNPATFYDVSFLPDLGFNLFSFHVVQEQHEIILNEIGFLECPELGLRNVRGDKIIERRPPRNEQPRGLEDRNR